MSNQRVTPPGAGALAGFGSESDLLQDSTLDAAVPQRSVKEGATWTAIANVVNSLSQWGILSVTARTVGAAGLGAYGLGIAVTAPLFMFIGLRLRVVQASDAGDKMHTSDYVRLRIAGVTVAMCAVFVVVVSLHIDAMAKATIIAVAASKTSDSLSDILYGRMQQLERMDLIAISTLARAVLGLAGFSAGLNATHDTAVASWCLTGVWVGVLVLYDVPVAIHLTPSRSGASESPVRRLVGGIRSRYRNMTELLQEALPLGVVALLASLTVNIPRYVVEWFGGTELLGYYTSVSYILIAGVAVFGAVAHAALPRLAKHYAGGRHGDFLRLARDLAMVAFATGVLGWLVAVLAGPRVLGLLYGASYSAYGSLFTYMMIAGTLNFVAIVGWFVLTSMRLFSIQLPLFVVDNIITFAVSASLYPHIGVLAAPTALCAAFGFHIVSCFVIIRRALRRRAQDLAIVQ